MPAALPPCSSMGTLYRTRVGTRSLPGISRTVRWRAVRRFKTSGAGRGQEFVHRGPRTPWWRIPCRRTILAYRFIRSVFGTNQLVLGQQVHLYADGGTAVSVANTGRIPKGSEAECNNTFFRVPREPGAVPNAAARRLGGASVSVPGHAGRLCGPGFREPDHRLL
jgi:hypothetical protein